MIDASFNMDLAVILNEVFCTFLFVSVILMVKGKHTAGDRKGVCAAICVVASLCAIVTGTNKLGASFNPAVAIAITTNSVARFDLPVPFNQTALTHYLYAYTLGPAIGGLLAGIFHLFHAKLHDPDHTEGQTYEEKQNLISHE